MTATTLLELRAEKMLLSGSGFRELQIQHFYKADPAYGDGVAKGLGLDITKIVESAKELVSAE